MTGFVSEVINLHMVNNLICIIRGSLGDLEGNCGNNSMQLYRKNCGNNSMQSGSYVFIHSSYLTPIFTIALPTL
jgi:hypothetical protein